MTVPESPSELLRRIYDEEFGFLPTNSSMKPVHVANGLARRVVGAYHDFSPLAQVLRQFVDNQRGGYKEERYPNSSIMDSYGEHFVDDAGNAPRDDALTLFRALARDTLGADDAVFPSQASFTLSHETMITSDISDNGVGDFLATLLRVGKSPTPAADLLVEMLSAATDPWTTLGWPLLGLLQRHEAVLSESMELRASRRSGLFVTDETGNVASPTLRILRERYDQLAMYERDNGYKLTSLRRFVLFGVFAVHVHMVRRAHEGIASAPNPPILLDMFEGRRKSLRDASAATLQGGFRAIEQFVLHRIHEELESLAGGDFDSLISELPSGEVWDAVRDEAQAIGKSEVPGGALAEAYWKVGYSSLGPKEVQGLPWNTLLALGRRSGFLMPYDNRGRGGREHKRYGATAEFAEMLVISTVDPEEPVEFDEFLERLRTSFGIVVGRPQDFAAIRVNDLRDSASKRRSSVSVVEPDLRDNLMAFRDLVIDIGFAKAYADGRTVVTTAAVDS